MHKRIQVLASMMSAVLILSLALFLGCSQKSPTAPDLPQPAPVNLSISSSSMTQDDIQDLTTGLVNFTVTYANEFTIEYQSIGDLANEVKIPMLGDSIILILPPNSVPRVVNIYCAAVHGYNDKGKKITILNFGPDGLVFNTPLLLDYKSSAPNGTQIGFYWFDELSLSWKVEEIGTVRNGHVIYHIRHFSKYSVVEGSTSNGSQ